MAILSRTHITINGNQLTYYNSCNLKQEIGEHHTLDLYCLLETIEKFCKNNDHEIEDLLGTILTIETKSYAKLDFHGTLKFKGIVTGINYKKGLFASEGDLVLIKAVSPTIIADDGPHYTSYNETSFKDIIEDNFSKYDSSRLNINTKNSKLTEPLIYTVQYHESCFKFAQRMAARNGEWMYYNGEELMFGLDTKTDELELVLGRDLHELNTALVPISQNFDYFTNDYLTDDVHEKKSASTNKSSDGYFGILNDSSKDIYANPTKVWVNISDDANSKSRLDSFVELQQGALQSNQIKVSGTSDNPGVVLASTLKISDKNYIVTSVTHAYSSNGEYENYFEATSANVKIYPKTEINAFPMAHSQTAKIIENNDPDGMGRVKVQFPWQKLDGLTTPWIRNMSPSASQGQGFFFIPEVDDEVLVDFEGGNAEAPYVMGSVYNSKSTPPEGSANENNHIKMLMSRSGSFFKLNDEDGSITIQDKAGSTLVLDGSGNIVINAKADINLVALDGSITLNSPTINIGDASSTPDNTNILGKTIQAQASKLLELKSDIDFTVEAVNSTITGTGQVTVEGTKAKLDGTALTEIKGGVVKLN